MKLKKKIIIYVFILLNIINNAPAKENKILTKVNNEIITTIDLLNEIKFLSFVNKEFENIEKNQQIEIAKNSLIKDKIKSIEILKFKKNINLGDKNFERVLKNYFQNRNINNLDDYRILFKNINLDFEFVREKISIDTFWKTLIYEKFYKDVKIDTSEIKRSISEKEKQNEYLISEIVFTLDENENFKQKVKKINDYINEKNFAEAALNFSISDTSNNSGKLGWIKENALNKKIKNELKNINKGEFTNPIVIPGGFLILKKEDVREIKISLDINRETKNIINKKTNDQLNNLSNIYLKKLRKNIQINEI